MNPINFWWYYDKRDWLENNIQNMHMKESSNSNSHEYITLL